MARILVIEDNPDIIANLFGFLEPLGYTLDVARSGHAGFYEEGVQVIVIRKGSNSAQAIEEKIREIIEKNNRAVK